MWVKVGMSQICSTIPLAVWLKGVILFCLNVPAVLGECSVVSNIGTDFHIGLPFVLDAETPFWYKIVIASETPGNVFLEAPLFGKNQSYPLHSLSASIQLSHPVKKLLSNPTSAVYLKSDVDVSVVVFTYGNHDRQTDAILALPDQALSTDYVTVSAKPVDRHYPAELVIVGAKESTNVSTESDRMGVTNFNIGRSETNYDMVASDYSGVQIHSEKPIAVVSGVKAAVVPTNGRVKYGAETIVETMLPNTFGGYNFVVPSLPARASYVIKVIAIENSTTIYYQNSTSYGSRLIDRITEMTYGNESVVLFANKPILVYQFGLSSANENYPNRLGAFIRVIPATENYVHKAVFVVQSRFSKIDNYVTIVTRSPSEVSIDNILLSSSRWHHLVQNYVAKNQTFSVFTTKSDALDNGNYHVINSKGNGVFGALITGYSEDSQAAYGYSLGIQAKECDGPGSTTTALPYIPTTTSVKTTARQYSTNASLSPSSTAPSYITTDLSSSTIIATSPKVTTTLPTNVSHDGPLCLKCNDLNQLYLCDAFIRCSPEQMCYVERYQSASGQRRYRTGCKDISLCPITRRNTDHPVDNEENSGTFGCVECCHDNFCNSNGCDADNFPYARGPACLTCLHTLSIDDCNTVSYCQPDEVCSIQVTAWFGALRKLQLQCSPKQCLHKRYVVEKRESVLCQNCCDSDYCNQQCSVNPPEPNIVG